MLGTMIVSGANGEAPLAPTLSISLSSRCSKRLEEVRYSAMREKPIIRDQARSAKRNANGGSPREPGGESRQLRRPVQRVQVVRRDPGSAGLRECIQRSSSGSGSER